MALQSIRFSIQGIAPLLMKNGQTADPLNEFAKKLKSLTEKKKKTDAEFAELSRVEWHSALYTDDKQNLILPDYVIEASIVNGAKKARLGTAFKSAIFVAEHAILDIGKSVGGKFDKLYEDGGHVHKAMVVVNARRISRTRPVFNSWSTDFVVQFDDEQLNKENVVRAVRDAGSYVGVGDWRPKYGRFSVVKAELLGGGKNAAA